MTENFPLSLIILLPLLGAVLNLLLGRRLGNTFVSLVACSAVAGAALVATKAVLLVASDLPMRGVLEALRPPRGALLRPQRPLWPPVPQAKRSAAPRVVAPAQVGQAGRPIHPRSTTSPAATRAPATRDPASPAPPGHGAVG